MYHSPVPMLIGVRGDCSPSPAVSMVPVPIPGDVLVVRRRNRDRNQGCRERATTPGTWRLRSYNYARRSWLQTPFPVTPVFGKGIVGLGPRARARPGSQLYTGLIGPARPGRALFVVEPDLAVKIDNFRKIIKYFILFSYSQPKIGYMFFTNT